MTQAPIPYSQPTPWYVDLSHLKTLAICHYVWGGLSIAFSSLFIGHIVWGVMIVTGAMPMNTRPGGPPLPQFFGWMMIGFASAAVLFGWVTGVLTILSGRCLARQRNRGFSMVMAGINCLSVPFGTILGVFTFVILAKPTVQMLYAEPERFGPL